MKSNFEIYPLINLPREFKFLKKKINPLIQKIFNEGSFTLGKELEEFEKSYANYCHTKYCMGTSSGTVALLFTIKSLGIGEGDEVIVPALTFTATAEAVVQSGAKPVFADVKKDTFLIDPEKITEKITEKTRAVIGVHLYGLPVDVKEIKRICKKNKLFFIEDAAQAHGATYEDLPVGSFGDAACFSFMAAKNLSGPGDGGCVTTNNKEIKEFVNLLRDHGRKSKNDHVLIGYSGRLDNLKAAILNLKLSYLDDWNKRRKAIADLYRKNINLVDFQHIPGNRKSCYCLFVMLVENNRDKIFSELRKQGILVSMHYPKAVPLQSAYSSLKYKKGDFPIAEDICKRTISLPMNPFLSNKEVLTICEKINQILKK